MPLIDNQSMNSVVTFSQIYCIILIIQYQFGICGILHNVKCKKRKTYTMCTCWSHLRLVASTEYVTVIKSLHSPPSPPLVRPPTLYMQQGGEEGVWCGRGRLCLCVGGHGVSGGGEGGVSLRIRPARLASSRLPGSLKLFDDRTGQHHCRWGVGGCSWCWWWWGMEACHLYTAVSFILSSSPPPPTPHLFLYPLLLYPLLLLLCSVSETPSSSLKKLYAAARHPGLQPDELEQAAGSGNNFERHQHNSYH